MLESGGINGGNGEGQYPFGGLGMGSGEPLSPAVRMLIKIGIGVLVLILLIVILSFLKGIFTNWLWYSSLGLRPVYTTILVTRVWLFFAGLLVMGALLAPSLWYAYRSSWGPVQLPLPPETVMWLRRALIIGMWSVGALITLIFAQVLSGSWEDFLLFLNSTSFGRDDPLFHKDVSFYVFTMPALHMVQGWLLGAAVVLIVASASVYFLVYSIRGITPLITPQMRTHGAILGAGFMFTIAAAHYLDIFEMLFSPGSAVTGATYADVTARLPALRLLTGIALLSGLIMLGSIWVKNLQQAVRLILVAFGLWVVAAILAGVAWPALVQRFAVDPSELDRERPYIERNIEWTRYGFDLERVVEERYEVREEFLARDLANNPETVNNIRLWDPRPLLNVYNQIQHLRLYYTFLDADVDRYVVDGEFRQVLVGTRELFPDGLDIDAQNWVNRKLVYTHGFGAVMSPATDFTAEGQPLFFIKDVPPSDEFFTVDQPRIYYGEGTDSFVIVNSKEPEFDRPPDPAEVSGLPVYIDTYDGTGGVVLSSLFRRAAFAWEFADINVLISGQVTSDSRVLYRRTIQERVSTVAPFLLLDRDPYMVVDDGRLFWIQDAYTTTDRLPYSKRLNDRDLNYIRNSVKVVIDAFNGTLTFYIIEPDDPLVLVYQEMFPGLFQPFEEMPPGLQEHIRYPERLFRAQSTTYLQYHMTDSKEFFLKEDQWEVPNEVVLEGTLQLVEPYYVNMKLPGEEQVEFVMILPFTPKDKPNLVAWMAARSDGEHYGELLAFTFPQDRLFHGPAQVEARIDNDPAISEQFTLWGQSGSIVIRGNLLVIPIGENLLYAEPIYLQAETLEFPELKRVILVTANQVVMEPTLDEAVAALLGGGRHTVQPPVGGEPVPGGIPPEELRRGLEELREALDALRGGLEQMDESLEGLQELTEGGAAP